MLLISNVALVVVAAGYALSRTTADVLDISDIIQFLDHKNQAPFHS